MSEEDETTPEEIEHAREIRLRVRSKYKPGWRQTSRYADPEFDDLMRRLKEALDDAKEKDDGQTTTG